jgi:hypothetical protein
MKRQAWILIPLFVACTVSGIAGAQAQSAPAVFTGKAAIVAHPTPQLGVAPQLSFSARIARAKTLTGANVTQLSRDYAFTLSPAVMSSGNRGYLSFLGPSMVIGNPAFPWAMLNTGQTIELLLLVPPSAGKVLEVDLKVQSAFRSTLTVTGMGSNQTFALTNTAQRVTLLTLLPVSNNTAYWRITGTGDSWFFTGVDISTIQ